MSVYVVSVVDFDSMENSVGRAQSRRVLGYAATWEDAEDYVSRSKALRCHSPWRAWDGEAYPQFLIEEVKQLSLPEET